MAWAPYQKGTQSWIRKLAQHQFLIKQKSLALSEIQWKRRGQYLGVICFAKIFATRSIIAENAETMWINFKQDFILGHNKISPDLNNDPDEVSKFHNTKVSTFNTNGFWFLPNILMFFTKYGKFQCDMADCHNQDEYLENRNNQIVV